MCSTARSRRFTAALSLPCIPTRSAPRWPKDIDGSEEAGAGRLLDGTGRVKFSNLRYGTYYLKETQTPDGFTGVGEAIQVTLNQDGTVTAGGKTLQKGEALTVDNTTDENGPGYAAFWKKGMGSGENTEKFLPGVSFRLTNNDDASKVYTAVSGSDGWCSSRGFPPANTPCRKPVCRKAASMRFLTKPIRLP